MYLILDVLTACWSVLAAMAPYLLLGFGVAGMLSVLISPEWVERRLGGRSWKQVLAASLFGVPLPLCSCGVLPVAASLRRHGAGKGATTAFLLSTPQTGVDSIAVTYALLGPFLAVFRPVAALVAGLFGGVLVQALDPGDGPSTPQPAEDSTVGAACGGGSCCSPAGTSVEPKWRRALRYGFVTLPRDIGKALLVGVLVSGVLAAVVPPDSLHAVLGSGFLPVLAAMALGVPLYVCATASVPIALGLIHAGLSPGAAIAFLVSGPATNAAALTTLWRVLGRRTTLVYLLTVAVAAVGAGLAVDGIIASGAVPASAVVGAAPAPDAGEHGSHGGRAGGAAALVLLAVLAASMRPGRGGSTQTEVPGGRETLVLPIEGMRCNGCVQSLTRALGECGGVESVTVSLEGKRAEVRGSGLDREELAGAVRSLGFEVPETPAPADRPAPLGLPVR